MDHKRPHVFGLFRERLIRTVSVIVLFFFCYSSVFVRNDAGTFLRKLDERVKYYDTEIEKLCNFQYQSFVNSFHELLQVRKDTTSMKVRNH
jgi:hypothetical protein